MRSLALANQKGGVGKTTTAVHLAHGLALAGDRVVLLDLDPQGNATLAVQSMVQDSLPDGPAPSDQLLTVAHQFRLLPSPGAHRNLAPDARLDTGALTEMSKSLDGEVDWLLVDCPPRMDAWGWAGLQLCQEVLVPVQAEFFAMHGLSQMLKTLERARQDFPGKAALMGVLVTMLDVREPISFEVLEDLRTNLETDLLESVIFRDAQLVEAASHGKTLFDYNPRSKGARSYCELVREVIHGRTQVG